MMSEPKPTATQKRTRKKTGRPTRYNGKAIEIALMMRPQDLALITRLAKHLRCSRSDALADILSRHRQAILNQSDCEDHTLQRRRA